MNLTAGQYEGTGIAMRQPYGVRTVGQLLGGGDDDAARAFNGIAGGAFGA